ncbi:MAG: ribosome small subunit-dependent GTPase A [Oscillospiraceae bacterium]
MTGIIYKGIGGFYYVKAADGGIVECKPRGLFRKQNIKPVAGDKVVLQQEAGTLYIHEILPRSNVFVRPPVANVDQMLFVLAAAEPSPGFSVADKLLAVAVDSGVTPLILVTKTDLAPAAEVCEAYKNSGIRVLVVSGETGEGLEELRSCLQGKLSVFCGNSGVGKSTLLNALLPAAGRNTAAISQKLGRGKHTTREVEIFEVGRGLVADTPGFASFDLQRAAPIPKENIQFAFPEIAPLVEKCRFPGCTHIAEKDCAVLAALQRGAISQSRYNSYAALYQQAKDGERR